MIKNCIKTLEKLVNSENLCKKGSTRSNLAELTESTRSSHDSLDWNKGNSDRVKARLGRVEM